jgi:large subunit ribosomal protein L21
MDAVVRTGGKQYRVRQGSVIDVSRLPAEPGSRVELSDVLLVSDGDNITVGAPVVEGATVVAQVVDHGRAKKVINFRYKAKTRFRRKMGHRQDYTRIKVEDILIGGAKPAAAEAPARRTRRARVETEAAAEAETPVVAATETPAEEAPAPRRRRRTAATDETKSEE